MNYKISSFEHSHYALYLSTKLNPYLTALTAFRYGSRYSVVGQTGWTNQVRHVEVDGFVSKMGLKRLRGVNLAAPKLNYATNRT